VPRRVRDAQVYPGWDAAPLPRTVSCSLPRTAPALHAVDRGRHAGAAPCCVVGEKRKARGRAARGAMGGSTTRFRAMFWCSHTPVFQPIPSIESPNHVLIGLFRAAKWPNSPCECRQPPRLGGRAVPLECSVGNAPARPRALTVVACAWPVLPLEVRRQMRWLASRRRQRGAASRPPAAAPGDRAGCCRWKRRAPDAPAATGGSLWFPTTGAGVLNRSSMAT
jgi:hypothetical protein